MRIVLYFSQPGGISACNMSYRDRYSPHGGYIRDTYRHSHRNSPRNRGLQWQNQQQRNCFQPRPNLTPPHYDDRYLNFIGGVLGLGNRYNIRGHTSTSYRRPQNNIVCSEGEQSHTTKPPEDPLRKQQQQNTTRVSMTNIPFLEVIASLLEVQIGPTGHNGSHEIPFVIQEHLLKHFKHKPDVSYQVVIRFCKYDSELIQKDYFPPCLQLKVNRLMCPLPGWTTVPKGPATPIKITSKCDFHRSHNFIQVRTQEQLMMFVLVTRRLTHEDLLQKLLSKSSIPPNVTVARIKEKLQEDQTNGCDITMTSLHFALLCPLSKARMKLPCRAVTCEHLQCFDAAFFLMMNERKPKWICPVCANPVEYENLQIDEHFKNILEENISSDIILLQADGNWKPFQPKDSSDHILTLDDSLDCSNIATNPPVNITTSNVCEAQNNTICLSSDDEASELDDTNASAHPKTTDLAPSTSSQSNKDAEVVVLSDDSFGSPPCNARQQHLSPGPQKSSARRSGGKTTKRLRKLLRPNDSIGPLRMTLRSHTRGKQLPENSNNI